MKMPTTRTTTTTTKQSLEPVELRSRLKTFLVIARFKKNNYKMTARPLTVIPPKCTGVPITQPEKIQACTKVFF
jgi:hypothetical protein